jgi:mRNA interferase RelE/StbE
MELKYTVLFNKDIAAVNQPKTIVAIEAAINYVKNASSLIEIKNLKKLKGYKSYYRIRIGDYRIGIYISNDIIEFSRFLHRKDIY